MEEDRISQLPDPILQQILSLIDINEAVQTAILSTRWKNLWRSLSDLHFHITHLSSPHFVSTFLSHRDPAATVRTFHLSLNSRLHAGEQFMEECVHYAATHGVQSLRLRADCSPPLKLAAALFASKTLRELDLRHFSSGVYLPGQFCLPHLKTLHLEHSVFINGGDLYTILEEPFSGFPELEKLTLRWFMVSGLLLKAPKLRFLHIIDEKLVMKEISAPLLTWFRYEGSLPFECSKVNLPMLEEVYLDIHESRFSEKGMHVKCVRMLQQLGNATIVSLTLDTLKVLEMDGGLIEQSTAPFPYMKCLKLIKGCGEICNVLQRVMNYLTVGTLYYESSLKVEFPDGVAVVEQNSQDLFEDDDIDDELQLDLFD